MVFILPCNCKFIVQTIASTWKIILKIVANVERDCAIKQKA